MTNKVNSATVIDLVVHILEQAKSHVSPKSKWNVHEVSKTHDKIEEAIKELQEHLTTVKTTEGEELTIDINQYVQIDDEDENVIYFRESTFVEDAHGYLQHDNPNCFIKIE